MRKLATLRTASIGHCSANVRDFTGTQSGSEQPADERPVHRVIRLRWLNDWRDCFHSGWSLFSKSGSESADSWRRSAFPTERRSQSAGRACTSKPCIGCFVTVTNTSHKRGDVLRVVPEYHSRNRFRRQRVRQAVTDFNLVIGDGCSARGNVRDRF